MKKTLITLFMVLLCVMLIISCNGDASEPKTQTPAETPTETPPKAIGTLAELEDAVKTEGNYYLSADITIVGYLNITASITLGGKDKTINVDYETTCLSCNGNPTSTQPCGTCGGSGSYSCPTCNGTGNGGEDGDEPCSTCGGGGSITCPTSETTTCSNCNGAGKKALDEADTGLVIKSEGVTLKNIKFVSKTAGGRNHAQVIIKANGTSEKPIVIDTCSFDSDKTLDKTFQESAIIGNYGSGAYLTVKNCTIKNMKYGMYFNQISNATISGNTIDGTKYNGINVAADSEDYPCSVVKIENNTLTNISYANYSEVNYSCGIFLGKKCSEVSLSGNNITMLNSKTDIVQSYLN
jgi:hypothetical protein